MEERIERLGLRMKIGEDFEVIDQESDPRYRDYWETYHEMMQRRGVTEDDARTVLRANTTVIGSLMVCKNEADSIVCGVKGKYHNHLKDIQDVIGLKPGVETPAALSPLLIDSGTYFFCDTQITPNPTVAQISEMTLMAAEEVRRFGIRPKVALLSHSNFGSVNSESARKMRAAYADIRRRDPELEIDGEMQADTAISEVVRQRVMSKTNLTGQANLFIMPNVDAANIAFNMVKAFSEGVSIGPMLLGAARPVHIVTPSVSTRGIVNISALSTVGAQIFEESMTDNVTHRLIQSA